MFGAIDTLHEAPGEGDSFDVNGRTNHPGVRPGCGVGLKGRWAEESPGWAQRHPRICRATCGVHMGHQYFFSSVGELKVAQGAQLRRAQNQPQAGRGPRGSSSEAVPGAWERKGSIVCAQSRHCTILVPSRCHVKMAQTKRSSASTKHPGRVRSVPSHPGLASFHMGSGRWAFERGLACILTKIAGL